MDWKNNDWTDNWEDFGLWDKVFAIIYGIVLLSVMLFMLIILVMVPVALSVVL